MSKAEQADLNFALWDAAKNGETDKVAGWVAASNSMNCPDTSRVGLSPILSNRLALIESTPLVPCSLVADGANVNYYDPEMLQATALHWAANNGHEDTVERLIELGASVKPTNQVARLAAPCAVLPPSIRFFLELNRRMLDSIIVVVIIIIIFIIIIFITACCTNLVVHASSLRLSDLRPQDHRKLPSHCAKRLAGT